MKKILALILAALMVLTMVACAAKAEPAADAEQTTTTEPAEETTPEQTAPAEETTEEPAVGGTISVFATSYTDAKLEMFQEIINDFTAETGIQVDLITPGSEGEAQLKTMMASNSLPDVWMTHGWSLLRYSEYLKVVNDQPWFDTIDKDSLAGVMADENGNFYALGMSMSISGLIYNKDALDKAGVDPNSIRTWDDFDAACEKLVAAGITPLAIGGSVGGNLAGLLGSVAPTFWTDEGAKYDLGDSLKDGTFDFDTYATELYEYLATWMKKGYINEDVLTLDAAGAQQMLGSGEAAFMVRGTDNITVARQYYPDANMGVLPLPSSVMALRPSVSVKATHGASGRTPKTKLPAGLCLIIWPVPRSAPSGRRSPARCPPSKALTPLMSTRSTATSRLWKTATARFSTTTSSTASSSRPACGALWLTPCP